MSYETITKLLEDLEGLEDDVLRNKVKSAIIELLNNDTHPSRVYRELKRIYNPKFKENDIVIWDGERYKVHEFQPNNGIGGSYWLKSLNGGYDGVASENDLKTE